MNLANAFDKLCDATLSLLYPQPCAVCGVRSVETRGDAPACADCWAATRLFGGDDTLCWKCGALGVGTLPEGMRAEVRCRRCGAEVFDAARACGAYEGALRATVLRLKREPFVPERLARMLCEVRVRAPLDTTTLIVPVPLHRERERERGFNQATLLGRVLAKRCGLRLDERSLVRVLHSERHRAGMDARARRESVSDAFAVVRPRLVEGERILLVDDVFTTGATASACAAAFKAAGALEVSVLTVARAV